MSRQTESSPFASRARLSPRPTWRGLARRAAAVWLFRHLRLPIHIESSEVHFARCSGQTESTTDRPTIALLFLYRPERPVVVSRQRHGSVGGPQVLRSRLDRPAPGALQAVTRHNMVCRLHRVLSTLPPGSYDPSPTAHFDESQGNRNRADSEASWTAGVLRQGGIDSGLDAGSARAINPCVATRPPKLTPAALRESWKSWVSDT